MTLVYEIAFRNLVGRARLAGEDPIEAIARGTLQHDCLANEIHRAERRYEKAIGYDQRHEIGDT